MHSVLRGAKCQTRSVQFKTEITKAMEKQKLPDTDHTCCHCTLRFVMRLLITRVGHEKRARADGKLSIERAAIRDATKKKKSSPRVGVTLVESQILVRTTHKKSEIGPEYSFG